ncbi:putative laccase-9 [Vitis vinifera]|uniref:Laccase n=1 Tax=Vitis vinifera TaxID=29760 RepID=A0A438DPY0_VITVI|nr:putative laccase-9 [Vitis vinifera]
MESSVQLLLLVLLSGLMLVCRIAEGDTHYYDFVLKDTNFTRLCVTKTMLTVNESFPGPVVYVHTGDTAIINVQNEGSHGVTIHWHGVKQPRNPWSDGPDHITQCQIQPGTSFTQKVIFSEDQEGTLWWHAHSDWTRATVHGAIVVLPAEGTTYPFPQPDGEEVMYWNAELEYDLIHYEATTPESDAYTINGFPGDLVACSSEPAYSLVVDYGKTYLLRIVNAVMNSELFFAISEHNLTVVGTDGTYTKPLVTNYLMITPGQTMDVLITTNQTPSYYYMAIRQFVTIDPSIPDFTNMTATAILQYRGNYTPPASPSLPTTLPTFYQLDAGYNFTSKLRSLASPEHPANVPQNVTTRMFVTASINLVSYTFEGIIVNHIASTLNNISFMDPSSSILDAYYRHISGVYTTDFPDDPPSFFDFTGEDDLPSAITKPATKVKVLNYNETLEIVFQGTNLLLSAEDHPVHLHGFTFFVVGMGFGNFDPVADPKGYNLVDPPEQNTVRVPKNGWVAIRLRVDNPGVWLWHCHLDRHFTWGMATVFIVKDGGTPETSLLPPPDYMPPCTTPSPIRLEDFNDADGVVNTISKI